MPTTAVGTPVMEILLDTGAYRHLRFSRLTTTWEVLAFPGALLVRRVRGHDFVFATGADDTIASLVSAGPDAAYWSQKLTAGQARSWDYIRFTEWLIEEAHDTLELEYAEIDELLRTADLDTETRAREVLAADFPGLAFPDPRPFHSWDDRFLLSLHAAHEGLALYADRQN